MTEGAIGIIILLAISGITAVGAHLLLRRYFIAAFLSAVLSTVVFQIAAYLQAGYLDPFWPLSIPASGVLTFAVALLVGLIIRLYRTPPKSG